MFRKIQRGDAVIYIKKLSQAEEKKEFSLTVTDL